MENLVCWGVKKQSWAAISWGILFNHFLMSSFLHTIVVWTGGVATHDYLSHGKLPLTAVTIITWCRVFISSVLQYDKLIFFYTWWKADTCKWCAVTGIKSERDKEQTKREAQEQVKEKPECLEEAVFALIWDYKVCLTNTHWQVTCNTTCRDEIMLRPPTTTTRVFPKNVIAQTKRHTHKQGHSGSLNAVRTLNTPTCSHTWGY